MPAGGVVVEFAGALPDGADGGGGPGVQGGTPEGHGLVDVGPVLLEQGGGDVEADKGPGSSPMTTR